MLSITSSKLAVWGKVLHLCGIEKVVGTWRQEFAWTLLKLRGYTLLVGVLKLA
ncbi:hypothetical protein ERO13_A02G130101v2 [Gossypium hirsutum]|nr:hypothetical protein ERO13_A02G130101v2 [Gossypium hirsutum]